MTPGLSHDDLVRIFPFLIGVDQDGVVRALGPSLLRVGELERDVALLDQVAVRHPVGIRRWQGWSRKPGALVVLRTPRGLVLRGSWVAQPDGWLFLGAPALARLSEVESLGLVVGDFAAHDGAVDMMFMLQSRESALADARELQRQLEQQRDELTEAYRELREQEMAVAVAVRESAEKSSFLAGMSHELRTPLNAIIGYAELLMETDDTPHDPLLARHGATAPDGDLQRIHRSALLLLSLIDDILDIAKVEAGRMVLHPAPVRLAELAESVEETVRPLARQQGTRLVVEGACGEAVLDVQRVRQVALNLVSNALRATPSGTVQLLFRRRIDRLELSVVDDGTGMTPELLQRLFRPFSQGSRNSATQRAGGTGLGLTISRLLARRMGGDIDVCSVYGQGSEVTFWLPLRAA